jgi:tetratricopeptide (TPR) repeat protein
LVLIQVAEFYRKIQQDPKGMGFLQQALVVEPDNAQANHALGLLLIRQKRYQEALSAFKIATDSHEAIVDYDYIYAIALDDQKQTFKAIDVLVKANKRWPGNDALVSVLVAYLNKVGKGAEAQKYLH